MNSWNEYDVSYNYLNDIYFKFIEILKNEELINDNLDNDLNKIKQIIDSHKDKFQ